MRYPELKRRQRAKERLLPSEKEFLAKIDAIIGYEVALHLPAGSKFILGADDAERILNRLEQCKRC